MEIGISLAIIRLMKKGKDIEIRYIEIRLCSTFINTCLIVHTLLSGRLGQSRLNMWTVPKLGPPHNRTYKI